jgi:hypothetical protein
MPAELFWGRNQSLVRAAPYHVIYNPTTQMHEMIRPWKSSLDRETSPTLVKEALEEELDRYPVRPIERGKVKFVTLDLRTVESIETVLYPTSFFCSRCHKLYSEDPGNNDRAAMTAVTKLQQKIGVGMKCTCGGNLIQWRVLTVHECGDLIHIPSHFMAACRKHGTSNLYFENHGSERIKDWEIVCKAEGAHERKGFALFFKYHSDCPLKGRLGKDDEENASMRYETAPIQKATNFIPKVLRILNSDVLADLPRGADKKAVAALALGALRAKEYFSAFNPAGGMEAWIDSFDPKGDVPDAPKMKALKEIVETMPESPTRAKMLDVLAAPSRKDEGILNDSYFQGLISGSGYLQEAATVSVCTDRDTSTSIADLLEDPTLHPDSAQKLKDAGAIAKKLRMSSLRYVDDVALTSCLVGYTRGDYDPARVKLQLYLSGDRSGKLKYTVYTDTVRTEAIFVQLDPSATLKWVAAAIGDQAKPKEDFSADLFEIQKRYVPASVKIFSGPEDPWTKAQYVLLHTMSHLLIKALGRFSGLEQEGLSERIYPYQNSFIVYSNQNADFSLGGLAMAFEHSIRDVLETMVQDSEVCPYNPECETKFGACPACVYVAEISCENFNRVLDRRRLAPSKVDSFWH